MAKGRSSIRQKELAARKRMYTPAQAMSYEKCGCDPKGRPPPDDDLNVLGPDEKICPRHFTVLNRDGKCLDCD